MSTPSAHLSSASFAAAGLSLHDRSFFEQQQKQEQRQRQDLLPPLAASSETVAATNRRVSFGQQASIRAVPARRELAEQQQPPPPPQQPPPQPPSLPSQQQLHQPQSSSEEDDYDYDNTEWQEIAKEMHVTQLQWEEQVRDISAGMACMQYRIIILAHTALQHELVGVQKLSVRRRCRSCTRP